MFYNSIIIMDGGQRQFAYAGPHVQAEATAPSNQSMIIIGAIVFCICCYCMMSSSSSSSLYAQQTGMLGGEGFSGNVRPIRKQQVRQQTMPNWY
jgi:hypothetical protein